MRPLAHVLGKRIDLLHHPFSWVKSVPGGTACLVEAPRD